MPLQGISSRTVIGRFDHFAGDTVYITTGAVDAPPQYYATRNLVSVEQSIARTHPYGRGLLFGTAFGTTVGYAVYRITRGPAKAANPTFVCTNNGTLVCTEPPPTHSNLSIPIGAFVGLGGGFVIARHMQGHRWAIVQMSSLR